MLRCTSASPPRWWQVLKVVVERREERREWVNQIVVRQPFVTSARLADVPTATVVSAQCECCFISHASKFDFWIFTVQIGYGENNISVTIYRHRRLITGDYVCVFQNIGFALTTTSELTETACACTYCDFDWWLFWLVLTVYCWKKVYGLKMD